MSKVLLVGSLAFEAGILAMIVAGIAANQTPDAAALRDRRDMLTAPAPIVTDGWIEQNPLLFGGLVAVSVFAIGLLILIASNTRRPAS